MSDDTLDIQSQQDLFTDSNNFLAPIKDIFLENYLSSLIISISIPRDILILLNLPNPSLKISTLYQARYE